MRITHTCTLLAIALMLTSAAPQTTQTGIWGTCIAIDDGTNSTCYTIDPDVNAADDEVIVYISDSDATTHPTWVSLLTSSFNHYENTGVARKRNVKYNPNSSSPPNKVSSVGSSPP